MAMPILTNPKDFRYTKCTHITMNKRKCNVQYGTMNALAIMAIVLLISTVLNF